MAKKRKRGKGKPFQSQWRNTTRMINGEKRKVKVRKLPNGKEEVHVLFPKNKKIKENRRSQNLKGSAKASYLNKQRSPQARTLDGKKKAENTLNPTNENIETWRKNPRRYDMKGTDTP